MSTVIHRRIEPYPDRFKKEMLNQEGNQQLAENSVSQSSKKEYAGYLVINVFATVYGLWHEWGKHKNQNYQTPHESKVAFTRPAIQPTPPEVDSWRLKESASSGTASPYFRISQGYRSKPQKSCVTSRHSVRQQETTIKPVNSAKGGLTELGIRKDFGKHKNLLTIVFNDATTIKAPAGQLLQNCMNRAIGPRGDCKPVVLFTTECQKNTKSQRFNANLSKTFGTCQSDIGHCETVLGLLPILSCVLKVNQFSELVSSQASAIKKFISYAITVRLFLIGIILQQCEFLRLVSKRVNQSENCCEENDKTENIDKEKLKGKKGIITKLSSDITPIVLSNMANRGDVNGNGVGAGLGHGAEEDERDDMFMEDEDMEEDLDMQNVPRVPDFNDEIEGGFGDGGDWGFGEELMWNDGVGAGGQHLRVVPDMLEEGLNNTHQPHQLLDEFANQIICEDEFAAIANAANHLNPLEPPAQEEINLLFLNEEWADDLLLVNLNAANAA